MNQLSWLLYAADVASGLGGLAAFIAFLGCVALCASILFKIVCHADADFRNSFGTLCDRATWWSAGVFTVSVLVAVFTPSKDTLYAIAASEVGEQIVESPTANKAVQALNHWLDEQIEDDEDEESNK